MMSRPAWLAFVLATAVALTAGACSTPPAADPAAAADCITDFDADTDYFPDKSTVQDATNFTIEYHNSYQVLTVRQPFPNGSPESYVLVRCGAPAPDLTGGLAGAQQITVPVDSLFSASTTHLAMLTELDQVDVVTGVARAADVIGEQMRNRIDAGEVVDYAPDRQVNAETVISGDPDVLVTQGIDDAAYPRLRDAGIPVLANAECLEATPLGRAEWIKVFAALTGTEKQAAESYDAIRADYTAVAEQVDGVTPVQVLPGTMYQGTWSMPTGADYTGRLIVDAGGTFPWAARTGSGGLQLNFESVFAEAGQAPLWLVTSDWETVDDALAEDPRYGELAAVRDGQVWSATKAVGPGGGNDYWERGVARPDLVLADLVAILHPDLAPDHEFEFYRQVERG